MPLSALRKESPLFIPLLLAGLVLLNLVVFSSLFSHDFVSYDDESYILDNSNVRAGLTLDGTAWAFTTFHKSNWHPLSWLSHMLDVELFALHPGGHHAMSLLFHAGSTLLLFVLLRRMTGAVWPSFLAAALFGIHPLHVESVAWAAERKDVLSTFFGLTTITLYARYALRPALFPYLLLALAFILSLLAKPMLVTMPFVLLLLDYWPLRRVGPFRHGDGDAGLACPAVGAGRAAAEKIPLLVLAAASSAVTIVAQKSGGALAAGEIFPLPGRIANALVAYAVYLAKTVWPANLAVHYPHAGRGLTSAAVAGAALLFGAVTVLVVTQRKHRPYLLVGWFWFAGTLVPVIGIIQVGTQSMADRYTYFPLIGLFIAAAWLLAELGERIPRLVKPLGAGTALAVVALATVASLQVRHWQDSRALFMRAVTVSPGSYVANVNMAATLVRLSQRDEAIGFYRAAIAIAPGYDAAHTGIGYTYADLNRLADAAGHFDRALSIRRKNPEALNGLGVVMARRGRLREAEALFSEALEAAPGHPSAWENLERAREMLGRVREP